MTLPVNLLPKGANVPNGWPFDAGVFYNDPELTNYPYGMITGGVGFGAVQIILTSAQLLTLQTTAIQMVTAPGTPGKGFGSAFMLVPTELQAQYVFEATNYTLGNADNRIQVEYTGQTTNLISVACNGLVTTGANTVVSVQPQAAGNIAQANVAGLGLEAKLAGTTPALTLGDGLVVLTLQYDLIVLQ